MNTYDREKRSISLNGPETTIVLEHLYWSFLDRHAERNGVPWREVVKDILSKKPDKRSAPAWWRFIVTHALAQKTKMFEQTISQADIASNAVARAL